MTATSATTDNHFDRAFNLFIVWIALAFAILMFLPSTSHAELPAPVMHFDFDNNLTDQSGNGSILTIEGVDQYVFSQEAVSEEPIAGGGALKIDWKAETQIEASLEVPTGNSERTISFWSTGPQLGIIDFPKILRIDGNGPGENLIISFRESEDRNVLTLDFGNSQYTTSKFLPRKGGWYHTAIVVPNGAVTTDDVKVFINGIEEELTLIEGEAQILNTIINSFTIGIGSYKILLEELKIFASALTPEQIDSIFEDSPYCRKCGEIEWEQEIEQGDIPHPAESDFFVDTAQLADGTYIAVTDAYNDVGMARLDVDGNILWTNPLPRRAVSTTGTSDGGFVVLDDNGDLTKYTADGEHLWEYTSPESFAIDYEYGKRLQETADKGFILVGQLTERYMVSDAWIIKLNDLGKAENVKLNDLGKPENEEENWIYDIEKDDHPVSIIQTEDGGYAISGLFGSSSGGFASFILRTDALGNEIWRKTIKQGTLAGSLFETDDKDFIVGLSDPTRRQGEIVKLDSTGNLVWHNDSIPSLWARVSKFGEDQYAVFGPTTLLVANNQTQCGFAVLSEDGEIDWFRFYDRAYQDLCFGNSTMDGGVFLALQHKFMKIKPLPVNHPPKLKSGSLVGWDAEAQKTITSARGNMLTLPYGPGNFAHIVYRFEDQDGDNLSVSATISDSNGDPVSAAFTSDRSYPSGGIMLTYKGGIFVPPAPGRYIIRLTATDSQGASVTTGALVDSVNYTPQPQPSPSPSPSASPSPSPSASPSPSPSASPAPPATTTTPPTIPR